MEGQRAVRYGGWRRHAQDAGLPIRQRIGQPAGLGAVAAVRAAAGVRMRDIALAGKRDAQRAMDEVFERRVHLRADCADLFDRQLARQHQLREADVAQELRLLNGADVALRAGMQLDRRQVDFQQPHVLHDQRIDARLVQLPDLLPRQLEFDVVHDRVHRHEDAGAVAVRELDQGWRDLRGSCWRCGGRRRRGRRCRRRRRRAGLLRGRFRRFWRGIAVRAGGLVETWVGPR
jgi:hypothetical protein